MKRIPLSFPLELTVGDIPYTITGLLGRGGFSLVYEARPHDGSEVVAIKEFYPLDCSQRDDDGTVIALPGRETDFEAARNVFIREAESLFLSARRAFRMCEIGDSCYIVCDAAAGISLSTALRCVQLPMAKCQILGILRNIGKTLSELHADGYVHRSVSPSNLIIDGGARVALIDYGSMTKIGTVSPHITVDKLYSAPAVYQKEEASPSDDIYSLGRVLLRCMFGERMMALPTSGNSLISKYGKPLLDSIVKAAAEAPSQRWESLQAWLSALDGVTAPDEPLIMTQQGCTDIPEEAIDHTILLFPPLHS